MVDFDARAGSLVFTAASIVGPRIGAVVFDVGETLVDETREYRTWADWLGVPRHAFSAVFGAVIASGRDYREAFQASGLGSTSLVSGKLGLIRVIRRHTGRSISMPMCGPHCRGCRSWGCGWVSSVTRRSGPGGSSGA